MKRKSIVLLVSLIMLMPTMIYAYEEPPKGTMDNPYYSSKLEEGTVEFKGPNPAFTAYITAKITVSVVGELRVTSAYEKISELSLIEARGPLFFCYKVLLKAEDIKDGNAVRVTAEDFKVYDTKRIEVPILTEFEEVELLNGAGAYMYIGFKTTKGTFPSFIVFNNELWFDLISTPYIDE